MLKVARYEIPPLVRKVAEIEGITPEKLNRSFVAGRVVIPHNPIHGPKPLGIGENLRVKVNANIGTSGDIINLEEELKKCEIAIKYGADTIMDLSTGGDLKEIRRAIVKHCPVVVGSVPIYEAGAKAIERYGSILEMTEDNIWNAIESHAEDGIDFLTVHCGVTKESIAGLKEKSRVTGIVSRGGSFLAAWITHTGKENPLFENFDYLLELAQKYDFTLSLGDGLRPGATADATDSAQIRELIVIGHLVKRAREKNVQAMVEGPGHVPINQIESNVKLEKSICDGAPFYVLGPLVCDVGVGYDHITAAIGGAIAAYYGADYLCYVTPAEHLALPAIEDVRQGVIATKIAAHAADLAHGIDVDRDYKMSHARKTLDWETQFELALDGDRAREFRNNRRPEDPGVCTMCADLCAMKLSTEYVDGKKKDRAQ